MRDGDVLPGNRCRHLAQTHVLLFVMELYFAKQWGDFGPGWKINAHSTPRRFDDSMFQMKIYIFKIYTFHSSPKNHPLDCQRAGQGGCAETIACTLKDGWWKWVTGWRAGVSDWNEEEWTIDNLETLETYVISSLRRVSDGICIPKLNRVQTDPRDEGSGQEWCDVQ